MLSAVCSALNNAHNDEDDDHHNIDDDGDDDHHNDEDADGEEHENFGRALLSFSGSDSGGK